MVREHDLLEAEKRVKEPEDVEWVFEGPGSAWTEDGRVHVTNIPRGRDDAKPQHVVLWNTRVFPEDFLLEFEISPEHSNCGLAIVLLCATGKDGGGIFDLSQPPRNGLFKNYIKGGIDCYHISYWSGERKFSNMRKNHGFHLVASGDDHLWDAGKGPHTVRLLKVGGEIKLETRGQVALAWTDNGKEYGKVHGRGRIGLRTMGRSDRVAYDNFKVWRVVRQARMAARLLSDRESSKESHHESAGVMQR